MSERVAIDQDVRERAITAIDTSIALSAGAGSGKTSVLVSRLLALLQSGVEPRRIAAITFTEKAAGELQERVRDRLEAAFRADPDDANLARAMADASELVLATIHSFCQQLLVSEALEAGWGPDTQIGDELFAAPGVDRALRAWQREFEAEHHAAGILVRDMVRSSELRKAVARLVSFSDLEPVVDDRGFEPTEILSELHDLAAELETHVARCEAADTCKLIANNTEFIAGIRALARETNPELAVLRALLGVAKPSKSGGRKGDWRDEGHKKFKDFIDAWKAFAQDLLVRLHGLLVADLRARLLPAIAEAKAESGRAGFDDLLVRAARLLQDDQVRARVAARYSALLIDEVQDTDPIQAEVAALLARAPAATGAWDAHAPEPGHLFAVGDAKQSIYRFRRADVGIWLHLRGLIGRAGEALELRQNFRSVPGIVGWVNHAFADMPDYVDQEPWRGPAALDPVVVLDAADADEEITALVAHLLELHTREAEVVDPKHGELRPLRWDDVMILLPSWTRAEQVQQVLTDAGIPALVEGGQGFLGRPEIHLCLAAMRAIDEPADSEAIVLTLRGWFGCTHDQLLAHRNAEGSWRYTIPTQPSEPDCLPVVEGLRSLQELHYARGRLGWVPLLDELLRRTQVASVWSLLRDGDTRLANLDKLRTLIRQLEPECASPGEVITELQAIAASERDLNRADLDSAAVRITSYFKAKGLEAPVVGLCGATRTYSAGDPVVDRVRGVVALKVGGALAPPGWDEWTAIDEQEAHDERRRWMYVAATRARDQLVIAASPKAELIHEQLLVQHPPIDEVGHDELLDLGAGVTTRVRRADQLAPLPVDQPTFPGHDELVDRLRADPPGQVSGTAEVWQRGRQAAIHAATKASARWRSVGEIATRERVSEAGAGGVGALGGSLVHEVLEHLDLSGSPAELASAAAALLPRLRPDGLSDALFESCAAIVERILAHEVLARARAAPLRLQELPFTFLDRGRQVSGTIDLCFPIDPAQTSWVVVDWKSDVPPAGTPAHRNYQRQLALYAKALLATVAPCEQVETLLVGPYPEFGPEPGLEVDAAARTRAVEMVAGPLEPGLASLLADGLPVPQVGLDVGEDGLVAELAWEDIKLAVLLDPSDPELASLEGEGWTVLRVDTHELTWAEELTRSLRERFAVAESA